jgi:putative NIF3 family GTP cyclohydrolase 1 type 2
MKAKELYAKLAEDFEIERLKDDWSFMTFNKYIDPEFRKRYIGLVLDNTDTVNKVYTATMPDLDVIEKLLETNETDVLFFSHHAMGYDATIPGMPFYDIVTDYLKKLKERRISFYVLHLPLDVNGKYSTSVTFAKHLQFDIIGECCKQEGRKVGVVCKTNIQSATGLAKHISSMLCHEIKLIQNGDDIIRDGRVAVAAGGGSVDFVARELVELGINMYVTGCTRRVPTLESVTEFHRITKEEKINVIGATHYTTEKFACIAMVEYFEKLGLPAEFIEGKYFMEDL